MEIPRHPGECCYRRRRDDAAQRDLRICFRFSGCSSGECDGCGHRPADEWCGCTLGSLRHRSRDCHRAHLLQDSSPGFCPGYVYSIGAERSAAGRWRHQLVCYFTQQGCQGECGAWREGYAHRQRFHRRWSLDGCGQRPAEVWRRRGQHRRKLVGEPNV